MERIAILPGHRGTTLLRGEDVRGVDPLMSCSRLVAMQSAAKDLGLGLERSDIPVIDNVMSRKALCSEEN